MLQKIINKIYRTSENYLANKDLDFRNKEYVRLAESYKKNKEVKLHFGCGPRVLKGWINIDLSYTPCEEYLKYYTDEHYPKEVRGEKEEFFAINIFKTGLPLPDDSVDVIFHEDFIEHLTQKEQVLFLAETLRVIKKGSIHRINTPELLESMKASDFKKGLKGVYKQEWDNHIHFNVITRNILTEMAKMIGYSEIIFNNKNKSISPLIPKEYRPDINDRPENGNLYADLIK